MNIFIAATHAKYITADKATKASYRGLKRFDLNLFNHLTTFS